MTDEPATIHPAETVAAIWRIQLESGLAWLDVWMQFWRPFGVRLPPLEAAVDELNAKRSEPSQAVTISSSR